MEPPACAVRGNAERARIVRERVKRHPHPVVDAVRRHRLDEIRHAAETALRHLARPVDVVGHGLNAPSEVRHLLLYVEVVDEPVLVVLAARHHVFRAHRRTRHGEGRDRHDRRNSNRHSNLHEQLSPCRMNAAISYHTLSRLSNCIFPIGGIPPGVVLEKDDVPVDYCRV